MNGLLIRVEGPWAHFKRPETNNNPLTHDFITKTALLGMIGAVVGLERPEMRQVYPQASEDLCYGVQIDGAVRKESWSFKLRYASNLYGKRPVQMEFLKNPRYTVALGLRNERSASLFNDFAAAVQASEAIYTPVLGLHNCPADLGFISATSFAPAEGDFSTKGFITARHKLTSLSGLTQFRLGVDRIPTYQNDDFWNVPDLYVSVFYPSEGMVIPTSGGHFASSDGGKWVMI